MNFHCCIIMTISPFLSSNDDNATEADVSNPLTTEISCVSDQLKTCPTPSRF